MQCWTCGANVDLPGGKVSFRSTCEQCHAWLHCCRNCVNYQPGLPNDCKIPGTDLIADRAAANFCEDFVAKGKAPEQRVDPNSVSQRLFGEEIPPKPNDPKDRFKGLFD